MDKFDFLKKCQQNPEFCKDIINNFHKLYYYNSYFGGTWKNTFWMGRAVQKVPLDLWIYQEIIYRNKPDIIIETGSGSGGSTLFLANILDLIHGGEIFSIDIEKRSNLPEHKRISWLVGSSIDDNIINFIEQRIKNKTVMVVLDSDHHKDHVLQELKIYSKMVTKGYHLIAEDSNVGGFPVAPEIKDGPMFSYSRIFKRE